jgi:hypothetical protein
MASHGGLKAAQEAVGTRRERCGSGSAIMISIAMCLAATGIVALSLESFGAAVVFFGIAVLLIRFA